MCGRCCFVVHGCDCCNIGDTLEPPTGGCSTGCIVVNMANRLKLRVGDSVTVVQYEHKSFYDFPY